MFILTWLFSIASLVALWRSHCELACAFALAAVIAGIL